VIGYKLRERLTVDSERIDLEAVDTFTWVRSNGGWLCEQHTEPLIGDA
jgi:hypothetical protein